jgi:hypothetical protein
MNTSSNPQPERTHTMPPIFAKQGVKIEVVNGRMRTTCKACGELPEDHRIVVSKGSGKFQKREVYCIDCGLPAIDALRDKLGTLIDYLAEPEF